ncbi:AN1-type zinc finger domain-containing protein [Candidatus Nitrosotenuis cloacae]|uniref:AN1-type zinc finger domain-containing protein n=1 Tax=Candidatus Nitrosotenuis cloacae TaxID=1603555 RepID=UPI00228218EF|nr:AN1-type zinc finger domain-containing protein [Candidatus Nitrosotenuis cloacae]
MKKVNCAYCGNETDLPFECNYCKDEFCAEHRLPEEHRCVKLTSIRAKRFGEKKVIRKQEGGFLKRLFRRS